MGDQKKEQESRELIGRICLIISSIEGLYQYGAKCNGVKGTTLDLLYTLDEGRVCTQKDIAREWMVPYTTVHTITKECEAEGYVELRPIPGERRALQVCMTEKGRAFAKKTLQNVYRAEREAMAATLEEVGPDFVEGLSVYSGHLKRAFDEYVLDEEHRCCCGESDPAKEGESAGDKSPKSGTGADGKSEDAGRAKQKCNDRSENGRSGKAE